jgi:hypothetical protein
VLDLFLPRLPKECGLELANPPMFPYKIAEDRFCKKYFLNKLTAHLDILRHSFRRNLRRGDVGAAIMTLVVVEVRGPVALLGLGCPPENMVKQSPSSTMEKIRGLQSGNLGREHDEVLEREFRVIDSETRSCVGVALARKLTSTELMERLAGKQWQDFPWWWGRPSIGRNCCCQKVSRQVLLRG